MSQFIVLEQNQFDFEGYESSDHYQRFDAITELPEQVALKTNITTEDLAYGMANARPIQL